MKSKLTAELEKIIAGNHNPCCEDSFWLIENGEALLAILHEYDRAHIPVGTRVQVINPRSLWYMQKFIVKDSHHGRVCAINATIGSSAEGIYFYNSELEAV